MAARTRRARRWMRLAWARFATGHTVLIQNLGLAASGRAVAALSGQPCAIWEGRPRVRRASSVSRGKRAEGRGIAGRRRLLRARLIPASDEPNAGAMPAAGPRRPAGPAAAVLP